MSSSIAPEGAEERVSGRGNRERKKNTQSCIWRPPNSQCNRTEVYGRNRSMINAPSGEPEGRKRANYLGTISPRLMCLEEESKSSDMYILIQKSRDSMTMNKVRSKRSRLDDIWGKQVQWNPATECDSFCQIEDLPWSGEIPS